MPHPPEAHIIPGARILIVGDFPTAMEVHKGRIHDDTTLDRMLQDAGILKTECSLANVIRETSPTGKVAHFFLDKGMKKLGHQAYAGQIELVALIALARPTLIIALGPIALQVLTGKVGLSKWRGSVLDTLSPFGNIKVVPTYSGAMVNRMWEWRQIAVRDLQRAAFESAFPEQRKPAWNFRLRPSFDTVRAHLSLFDQMLSAGTVKLSVDIETRGFIACIGIAWTKLDAICIPLMAIGAKGSNYWTAEEETFIMTRLARILTHPNAQIIGQNFAYDAQYFAVHCGFLPVVAFDTMVMQHVVFPGVKKSLDFISSMYCEHYVYWKDDGKTWDSKIPEEQYWAYNCEDCVRTYECAEVLEKLLHSTDLWEPYTFMQRMWLKIVRTMLRGVRVDESRRTVLASEFMSFMNDVQQEVYTIIGHPINLASPLQLKRLFYDDLLMKLVRDKKTGQPTTNDEALNLFKKREPLLTGLVERIAIFRSSSVLLSTFILAKLDIDKRARTYYNVAGTETFRLSSSKNAFGSGGNMQNITVGTEDKDQPKMLEAMSKGHRRLIVPNLREMYIPDPGYTFFDCDLDRADLMIVIWEADDAELREAVAAGVDLHTFNASALFGVPETRVTYAQRQSAKMFAHGTNYGGSARTMAVNCGLTVHQSEGMQNRWFAAHPGIKEWHRRTEAQLQSTREVRNIFGYRRRYFDRIESVLPEALAWQPQSVVAIVVNKGWERLTNAMPEVEVLLQVHDSLAGQFPTHRANPIMREMRKHLEIELPYARPLTIGVGIATSTKSWGHCEARDWPEPLTLSSAA